MSIMLHHKHSLTYGVQNSVKIYKTSCGWNVDGQWTISRDCTSKARPWQTTCAVVRQCAMTVKLHRNELQNSASCLNWESSTRWTRHYVVEKLMVKRVWSPRWKANVVRQKTVPEIFLGGRTRMRDGSESFGSKRVPGNHPTKRLVQFFWIFHFSRIL